MAESIRGISVVISADTTGLSKALSDVNKKSRDIQSELKQVEKLLKLDPSNTELLAQKQKLLGDAIANTREKLDRLRSVQEQVNEQFQRGEISEGQYRAFQREVIKTEQELQKLEKQLSEVTGEVKEQGEQVSRLGKEYQEAFEEAKQSLGNAYEQTKKVGAAITAAGAAITAGLGVAVGKAADFEQAMANVYSVMAPDEVEQFRDELKDLALVMGAETKYSATEASRGIEELVKAGVSVRDILEGGLSGALSLATAGELELADAAEIASTALNAFREDGISVQQAADILAGAANASATSVQELKFGLSQVSSVASAVGLSFEDTATALAVFAQNGLKGSDAGTSLKTMLMNLQPSTDKAAQTMAELGLITEDGTNVFIDANGQFKSLAEIAGILRESLSGLSDAQRLAALETIFGSDAIRAANILYKEGADGINNMAAAMGEISAADVAAQKMDTFKGALEELSGSLETAQISIGSALIPILHALTDIVQAVVDGFNSLPAGVQSAIAVIGALVAALALIAGPLLLLIGFLPQIAAGFAMIAPTISAAGAALSGIAGPIGIAIAAIAGLVAGIAILYNKNEEFRAFVDDTWAKIKDSITRAVEAIRQFVEPYIRDMVKFVKGQLEEWKTFWEQNGEQILSMVKRIWDQIRGNIEMALGIIKGLFQMAWPIIEGVVKVAWENMKLIVSTALDVIRGIINVFLAILRGDWKGAWEAVKDTVRNIWNNVETFLRNINLKEIGKNIVQGFIEGLGSMIGAVRDRVKSIADAVTGGLKNALSIRSPSRVLMQLGEYTGEGFALGLERTIDAVRREAAEMAAAVTGGLSGLSTPGVAVQAQSSDLGSGSVTITNYFTIRDVNVREDADIDRIVEKISRLQQQGFHKRGVLV